MTTDFIDCCHMQAEIFRNSKLRLAKLVTKADFMNLSITKETRLASTLNWILLERRPAHYSADNLAWCCKRDIGNPSDAVIIVTLTP